MPTSGSYGPFWGSDPRRWERCRQQVAKQMIAEGWNKHAGKFSQVQLRRARRLFLS